MLSVRPIATHDWQKYRDIRLLALKESPAAFGSTWEQEVMWLDDVWSARTETSESGQSGKGFFAINEDEVCGLVWCLLSETEARIAHIYGMWVAPAARGHGAGGALLTQCITWAKSKGAHQIRLAVTTSQSPAVRLYTSQGFYSVGKSEFLRPCSDLITQEMQLDLSIDA